MSADGQTLAFAINRVNVYELKNWLREINLTSGVRLQKMNLTPVDHLSDVKAEIQLTWKRQYEYADTRAGELSCRVCCHERRTRRDPGSFLGVVAERVPGMVMDEENCGNLLFPASHCPVCQHSLHAWENIPLISWLVLRGRCRCCQTAIPLRLFLIELFTALFLGLTAGAYPAFRHCSRSGCWRPFYCRWR